jgi:1-acyl-sn-glycerol-3-phosphate acyltransferase
MSTLSFAIQEPNVALRSAAITAAIAGHCVWPNRRCLYHAAVRLLGFETLLRGDIPSEPAIWICNHFSHVDLLVLKAIEPELAVVVKKDLLDEVPAGVTRAFFRRAWTALPALWYDRNGKDTQIRDSLAAELRAGRSVLIFAEGTTQRDGPPMAMRGGSLEVARACGVPVQPVCLRYAPAIGLAKHDDGMRSTLAMMRAEDKKVGVRLLPRMDAPETIAPVHSALTEAYHELGSALGL